MHDLTGMRSGKLIVVDFSHRDDSHKDYWKCLCDCGNTYIGRADHLQSNKVKSCGCSRKGVRGHRTSVGQSSFVKLYCNYKSSAKKRGLAFELTQEQFRELIGKDCFYCGSQPSSFYEVKNMNGGILYNGIDRLKSRIGYIEGNVVPCCGFCNRAKIDLDVEEFLLWLDRVKTQTGNIEHKVREVQFAYGNAP